MKSRIARALAELRGQPKPQTHIASGGTKQSFFTERQRNAELLKKYETIYNQGGVISEAVDAYPLFCLSSGWRLDGEDRDVTRIEEFLDTIDFDTILREAITDCIVFGDAFQEIVSTRGGEIVNVVPRLARTFSINYDDYGSIQGFEQVVMDDYGQEYKVVLRPDQILHLQLTRLGGSLYGMSLIGRAYDDIMRDTKTAESTATAIHRHGFPKYHIQVGMEGEFKEIAEIKDIEKAFRDLEADNEFVTPRDVLINMIDPGGLQNIDIYNDVTIMRVAVGLGVPEELMGLRRGSTDATAVERIQTFYRKIATHQQTVARCYEINLFDRILGKKGAVRLIFNDVSPVDEAAKASWISEIVKSTPIDPFIILPRQWILEQFDIDPDAYEEEDIFADMVPDEVVSDENQPYHEEGANPDENITE